MAIEHDSIVDGERHEPKGVGLAASGYVYVADGAGSGVWSGQAPQPHGWIYYKDGATAQTFNTTESLLSIDGATTRLDTYAPTGVTDLWDTTGDKLMPASLGDSYTVRLDLPVTGKTGTPNKITVEYDIGGLVTPSNVVVSTEQVVDGTPPYSLSFTTSLFCLNTFIANGMQIFLKTDTGTLDITEPAIFITRTSGTTL